MNDTPQVPADWFRDPEYCAQLGRKPIGLRETVALVQDPCPQGRADLVAELCKEYTDGLPDNP